MSLRGLAPWLQWILLAGLALAALALRVDAQQHDYFHPDEAIATGVVDTVLASASPDTNWARAPVPEQFRYNQYNFSSYYLFLAGLEKVALSLGAQPGDGGGSHLPRLRLYSAWLAAAGIVLAGWLGFRLQGATAGLVAAALAVVATPLFQDALYARPETFSTLLVLALLLVTTRRDFAAPLPMAVSGLLIGVLVATKVSFALLLPFPAIALAAQGPRSMRVRAVVLSLAAIALGFAMGAPGAVAHPGEYLEGLAYLFNQYGNGHWPHGSVDAGLAERVLHTAAYLDHVLGLAVLLAAAIGMVLLVRGKPFPEAVVVAAILLTLAYFVQSRTFFERNLSHGLPVVFVIAGMAVSWASHRLSARKPVRLVLATSMALLLCWPASLVTWTLVHSALPQRHAGEVTDLEQRLAGQGYLLVDGGWDFARARLMAPPACGKTAMRFIDYGDRHSTEQITRLQRELGLEIVGHVRGPFHGAPASTLQTYHGSDFWYLAAAGKARDCAFSLAPMPRQPPGAFLETQASTGGTAARDAYHPAAAMPDWQGDLYGTWAGNDANLGTITLASPRTCAPIALPIITGPGAQAPTVQASRILDDASSQSLHDGPLPLVGSGWVTLRLEPPQGACSRFIVSVRDQGKGWGEWVGLGQPYPLPASNQQSPSE